MHVPYACRHSGACCTSGWPIPLERDRVAPVRVLRADGAWLVPAPEAPPEIAGVLANDRDGRCVFHRPAGGTRAHGDCEIQHRLGHSALPSACQHFPRECLIDPRGVFVTLSHYCPTAASLLFSDADVITIVEGPRAIPMGDPEGLDARDVLPPLLRPGLLMDHEAYGLWEAHLVRKLTGNDCAPEQALRALERDAYTLSQWRNNGALADAVRALETRIEAGTPSFPNWSAERELFAAAVDSLASYEWVDYPERAETTWSTRVERGWYDHHHVINRFLSAHAFAAWVAYQGNGVTSQIARLHLALAVLRAEAIRRCAAEQRDLDAPVLVDAIRRTDLLIVHLVERARLAARLCEVSTRLRTPPRLGRGRWSRTHVAP